MTAFFEKYLAAIGILVAIVVLFIACLVTYKLTDGSWQKKWDQQQIAIKDAADKQDKQNRQKEQEYQNEINRINSEGAERLATAKRDADTANAAVASGNAVIDKLRKQANDAILASNRTSDSSPSGTGKTAAQAVNLLADVLSKSIQRNKDLASFADDAWERGMTCQASYESILKLQGVTAVASSN